MRLLLRRDLNKPEVPWSARIDADDRKALDDLLPIHGAKSWVVVTALTAFVELMELSPSLRTWVQREVQQMRFNPVSFRTQDLNLHIPTDLYVRFNQVVPGIGGATWFLRRFTKYLIEDLRRNISIEEQVVNVVNRSMLPKNPAEYIEYEATYGPAIRP